MPNIKRQLTNGNMVVGYRPKRGAKEKYVTIASRNFDAFCLAADSAVKRGEDVPVHLFSIAPIGPAMKAKVGQDTTLNQWVGPLDNGLRAAFFKHGKEMQAGRKVAYETSLKKWAYPLIGEMYLNEVSRDNILKIKDEMLVCPECRKRATAANRDLPASELRVSEPPWDGRCIDEAGDSLHYARIRRVTMEAVITKLKTVFNVAIKTKDVLCEKNPVYDIDLPLFDERPSNTQLAKALSIVQLNQLTKAMPSQLRVSVTVKTFEVLRRSELFGLNLPDIDWRAKTLNIARVYVYDASAKRFVLRHWGKTKGSIRVVPVGDRTLKELQEHLRLYRSSPNPKDCEACAKGKGEMPYAMNLHRHCDFANDAPLFVDEDGKRFNPETYTRYVFPRAVERAGLGKNVLGFRITPKLLRATGATLLVESGTQQEQIVSLVGWSAANTFRAHYHKPADEIFHTAMRRMDRAVSIALGESNEFESIEEQLQALAACVERTEAENRTLELEVERLTGILSLRHEANTGEFTSLEQIKRPGPFDDIEAVRASARGAASKLVVLRRLGASVSGKSYKRLAKVCREHDIELPNVYGKADADVLTSLEQIKRPGPFDDIEAVRASARGAASKLDVLRRLGIASAGKSYKRLEQVCQEHGIELPNVQKPNHGEAAA